MSMTIISIMNVKGGVGKTVTAVNVAEVLASVHNKKVLLIDADAQADATCMLFEDGMNGQLLCSDLYGAITYGEYLGECIYKSKYRNLDIIPASSDLFYVGMESCENVTRMMRGIFDLLREEYNYDYVIIDCPPSFSAPSVAAICNSEHVVIPVKLDAFGLRGCSFLADQIEALHDVNPHIDVAGVLVTMWHNSDVCRGGLEALQSRMSVNVFDTKIRRTDKVDESTFYGQSLLEYSKFSSAGRDYRLFVSELLAAIGVEEES